MNHAGPVCLGDRLAGLENVIHGPLHREGAVLVDDGL